MFKKILAWLKPDPLLEQLREVLHIAHGRFTYISDPDLYGVPDYQEKLSDIPDDEDEDVLGDCDAFAAMTTKMCLARGITEVRRAICKTEGGQSHMVTIVDDKWVLDNRHDDVWEVKKLPYTWLSKESYRVPFYFVKWD